MRHALLILFVIISLTACVPVRVWSFTRLETTHNGATISASKDWMRVYRKGQTFYVAYMQNYELDSMLYTSIDSQLVPIGVKTVPDTTYWFAVAGPYVISGRSRYPCINVLKNTTLELLYCYPFDSDRMERRIEFGTSFPGQIQLQEVRYVASDRVPDISLPHNVLASREFYQYAPDGSSVSTVWDRYTGIPIRTIRISSSGTVEVVRLDTIMDLGKDPALRMPKRQAVGWPDVDFPWTR